MKHFTRGRLGVATAVAVLLFTQGVVGTADAQTAQERQVATLYAAAKKEGRLNLYTTANAVQVEPAIAGFKKRYPGVKVTWTRSSTPDLIQRFSAEAASKSTSADVMHLTDTAYITDAVKQGWLVPLNKANLPGGFPGTFPKQWVLAGGQFAMQTMSPSGIGYNTRMVKAADAPKTYDDLLDPQWKGKIIAFDPNKVGASMWDFWDFIDTTYGDSFLTKFRDQKPIWYNGAVPGQNANAAGEAPVLVPAFPSLVFQVKSTGGPVDMVVPAKTEGVLYAALPTASAKHPNAARLFVYDLYQKASADGFANIPLQVSPYGGGQGKAPKNFTPPDSVGASKSERKAQLAKLLGLKFIG